MTTRRPRCSWGLVQGVAVLLSGRGTSVIMALSSSSSPCSSEREGLVHTLILCRHGDSVWNGGEPGTKETFTGWTNVPLSRKGIQEAKATGKQVTKFCEYNTLDACFTSVLQRAQLTAHYCLWGASEKQEHPFLLFPPKYIQDYRLNERHYGALQGYVKEDVEQGLYGHDPKLVRQWRKSWSTVPPLLDNDLDPRRIQELKHFASHCGGPEHVPRGESIEQVANQRIRPFLRERLCPILQQAVTHRYQQQNASCILGGTGLVVAHANSLRALIGVICNVQDDPLALEKLESLRLQTAVPLILRFRALPGASFEIDIIEHAHIDDDNHYLPCDLDGVPFVNDGNKSPFKRRPLVPELPLYPLTDIPIPNNFITPNSQYRQQGTPDRQHLPLSNRQRTGNKHWKMDSHLGDL